MLYTRMEAHLWTARHFLHFGQTVDAENEIDDLFTLALDHADAGDYLRELIETVDDDAFTVAASIYLLSR